MNKQKNQRLSSATHINTNLIQQCGRGSDVLTASQINSETSIRHPNKIWNNNVKAAGSGQQSLTVLQHVPLTVLASKQKEGRKS